MIDSDDAFKSRVQFLNDKLKKTLHEKINNIIEEKIEENQQTNITQWVCDKGHHNFEPSEDVTGICKVCGELVPEVRSKPHYKWSWKLNKAVRL